MSLACVRRSLAAFGLTVVLSVPTACGWSYGPVRDKSSFVGAALAQGNTAVFSFADVAYRPAQGAAAFPDGGQAKFVRDTNVIGTYDLDTGKTEILRAEENTDFQNDSGHYTIVAALDGAVLLVQGGQLRGSFALETRHWLADLATGTLRRAPLAEELATRGRALGQVQLVDGKGTLLLTCPSLAQGADARTRRTATEEPELWLRRPAGEYVKIAATSHVERVEPLRIVYWIAATRQTFAFDVASGRTVALARYRAPPYEQVTRDVSPRDAGATLSLGVRASDGSWTYEALPLTHDELRRRIR